MMCYSERHTLLFECFITLFRYIRMIGRASDSVYEPLMAMTPYSLPKTTLTFYAKYQIWGIISAQHMGCFAVGRHMHCC